MNYKPVHYDVELDVDLENTRFTGTTRVDINVQRAIEEVVINALDLTFSKVQMLRNEEIKELVNNYDLEKQELTIKLDGDTGDDFSLFFEFSGTINDKLAGLYQSKYKVGEEVRTAAVTQFQENDARRAFPCFDEPGLKATFDITLIAKKGLTVISNGMIEEQEERGEKIAYKFERTPIMSTYLLFFGIGEFEFIEEMQDGVRHRVYASPGQAEKYGAFALDFAMKSLKYCQDYFVVPFPFSKMDQIATADFAHGAMENWSAILYRENYLLVYPQTSIRMKTMIQMVIAHEITHQWFGNSTSPATWKYIWLNESFATYFGFGVVDHYHPEKNIWQLFLQIETAVALGADAYVETAAIEKPGDVAVGMTIKTAPIIYNKGGSILRMLEHYVGAEGYRESLGYYLQKFKYDVATSTDLWLSIEKVTQKPVSSLMESWVLQPGYPMISVKRDGNSIKLAQNRFTYLDNTDETTWLIPVSITQYANNSEIKSDYILMEKREAQYQLEENCDSFKLNKDFTGFFRVHYENDELKKLGELVKNKTLDPIDRWNLVHELYAMMRSGRVELEDYLEFITYYEQEDNYQPLSTISGHLFTLYRLFDGEYEQKILEIGKPFFEAVLDRIKYEPQEGEPGDITTIRSGLIYNAVIFGSEAAEKFALGLFDKVKNGEPISADILGNVLRIGAKKTNDITFLKNKFENAENEQESVSFLGALGEVSDLAIIEELQEYVFEKVPLRNRTTLINTIITNPISKKTLWKWYLANLDNFESLTEYMYQGVLTTIIPTCTDDLDEMKEFFADYEKKRPQLSDALDIAMENVEINAKLLNKYK
jgi:aminopeptidase N